jgi:hypothetical protein
MMMLRGCELISRTHKQFGFAIAVEGEEEEFHLHAVRSAKTGVDEFRRRRGNTRSGCRRCGR